jgi:hypothetical protein
VGTKENGQWHTPYPIAPPKSSRGGYLAAVAIPIPPSYEVGVYWITLNGGIGTALWSNIWMSPYLLAPDGNAF